MSLTNKFPRTKLQARCCAACGEPLIRNVSSGRRPLFCSERCRDQARRDRKAVQRLKNGSRYPYGPEPRNLPANHCNITKLFSEKASRPPCRGIVGPAYVIRAEIEGAHNWKTEPSGYAVAQLKPPALRSPFKGDLP
jgi:hypothetical protein